MSTHKSYLDYVRERFSKEGWRTSAGVVRVARILENYDMFLPQQEIANLLQEDGKPLDYSTIHRILRKLESVGLAHEFDQKWHRENEPDNPLHGHFLICDRTGEAEEIYLDYFSAIAQQLAKEKGFLLREVKMAFYGQSKE